MCPGGSTGDCKGLDQLTRLVPPASQRATSTTVRLSLKRGRKRGDGDAKEKGVLTVFGVVLVVAGSTALAEESHWVGLARIISVSPDNSSGTIADT